MRPRDLMKSDDPDDPITITMRREEAERLSWGLSDLLCWHQGYAAAKGADHDPYRPLGVDEAREMNIKIKGAL